MRKSGNESELDGPGGPPRGFRRTVTSAFGATFAVLIVDRLIDVCFLAILARILPPPEFGVAAASVVLISFLGQFAQLGLVPTLIQSPQLTERTMSVAHTLAATTGALVFVLTQVFAPVIAGWFQNIDVVDVLRVSSVACLTIGLNVVPQALLARRMRARDLSLIEMACGIVGTGFVSVPLAMMGWGYWALIAGGLVSAIAKTILLWTLVKMPRRFVFDWDEAKSLWFRGAGYSLTVLLQKVATEGDRLIIGRYLLPLNLGLYSRANGLMFMPAVFLGGVIDRVAFPAFSRVQNDGERLRDAYRHSVALTSLVGLPLTVFLFFTGPDIIRFILGPDWEGAVIPFKILCLAMYPRLSDRVSGTLLRGMGRPYLMVCLQAFLCVVMAGGCVWSVRYGLPGVSWAVVGVTALSYLLLTTAAMRVAQMPMRTLVAAHGPGAALAVLTFGVLIGLKTVVGAVDLSPFLSLLASSAICGAAALVAAVLAPGVFLGSVGKELIVTAVSVIRRRKSAAGSQL